MGNDWAYSSLIFALASNVSSVFIVPATSWARTFSILIWVTRWIRHFSLSRRPFSTTMRNVVVAARTAATALRPTAAHGPTVPERPVATNDVAVCPSMVLCRQDL